MAYFQEILIDFYEKSNISEKFCNILAKNYFFLEKNYFFLWKMKEKSKFSKKILEHFSSKKQIL